METRNVMSQIAPEDYEKLMDLSENLSEKIQKELEQRLAPQNVWGLREQIIANELQKLHALGDLFKKEGAMGKASECFQLESECEKVDSRLAENNKK